MGFFGILLLALGEAMDAVAVAAAAGVAVPVLKARHVVAAAVVFGGFQGLMPVAGYALGSVVGPQVVAWDHWIVFVVLATLGAIALREAFKNDDDDDEKAAGAFAPARLLFLGFATSVDAFAVGVTLPLIGAPLLLSAVTIGVVTAILCAAAVVAGRRLGAAFGKKMEVFGGLVLIGIGSWTLASHLLGW